MLKLPLTSITKNIIEDVTIIAAGVTVQILGTICDGIPECFNGLDEWWFCGFSKTQTISIGKFHVVILHF